MLAGIHDQRLANCLTNCSTQIHTTLLNTGIPGHYLLTGNLAGRAVAFKELVIFYRMEKNHQLQRIGPNISMQAQSVVLKAV